MSRLRHIEKIKESTEFLAGHQVDIDYVVRQLRNGWPRRITVSTGYAVMGDLVREGHAIKLGQGWMNARITRLMCMPFPGIRDNGLPLGQYYGQRL